ncbi:MAG: hypothetical protein AB8I08_07830 [Sandaracinaceae bacterium]
MFEEAVQRVLRDPRLRGLGFACGPTFVSAAAYEDVAELVQHGRIHVRTHSDVSAGNALYAPRATATFGPADTLFVSDSIELRAPASSPAAMRGCALVVHEATHAAQDHSGQSALTRGLAEAAAYLAQAIYFRLHDETFREHCELLRFARQGGPRAIAQERILAGDRLLDAVEPVAARLMDRGGVGVVEPTELRAISAAVRSHPVYAGHTDELAGMNGIAQHHAP